MNIDKTVFIADGARVVGDKVTVGAGSSIWYNAVIRNTGGEEVVIGKDTNIQDLCMVHNGHGYSVSIGDGVTVGHSCIIHGCTIGDNTLIGMGSIVMNGAVIGKNCIIGAGSLVTEGKVIPDGSMAFGRPAKVIKELTEEQIEAIRFSADTYIREATEMMNSGNR
ncbi:MAG: gamma carbonic anhydrase family protein [Mogibacterium sp.]|nr:gamma carbonic anhydrase family protein [Mogibacterium sp.]